MKVLKNSYFLGECVTWGQKPCTEKPGTGRIDGIYESVGGDLVYRVARLGKESWRAVLLREADIDGRLGEDVPMSEAGDA